MRILVFGCRFPAARTLLEQALVRIFPPARPRTVICARGGCSSLSNKYRTRRTFPPYYYRILAQERPDLLEEAVTPTLLPRPRLREWQGSAHRVQYAVQSAQSAGIPHAPIDDVPYGVPRYQSGVVIHGDRTHLGRIDHLDARSLRRERRQGAGVHAAPPGRVPHPVREGFDRIDVEAVELGRPIGEGRSEIDPADGAHEFALGERADDRPLEAEVVGEQIRIAPEAVRSGEEPLGRVDQFVRRAAAAATRTLPPVVGGRSSSSSSSSGRRRRDEHGIVQYLVRHLLLLLHRGGGGERDDAENRRRSRRRWAVAYDDDDPRARRRDGRRRECVRGDHHRGQEDGNSDHHRGVCFDCGLRGGQVVSCHEFSNTMMKK